MADITLQMCFDSSFIDFNMEDGDTFLHKVSLLSVGNSYHKDNITDDQIKNQFTDLRKFLLPWNHSDEKYPPTHLRAWMVVEDKTKGKIADLQKVFDFPISNVEINNTVADPLKEYYEIQLEEQVQDGEVDCLLYEFNREIDIEINEDSEMQTSQYKRGRVQGMIAQMAQKLAPYNEQLGFLFLSNEKDLDEEKVKEFYENEGGELVFFPVSHEEESAWYTTSKPEPINDFFKLIYKKGNETEGIHMTRSVLTQSTKKPELKASTGNITLRDAGKFIGKVKIEVEQDNDWKLNITDELTNVLNFMEVFFQNATIKETIKEERDIKNVFEYFLRPFLDLNSIEKKPDGTQSNEYWMKIEKLIIDTVIAKNQNYQTIEEDTQEAKEKCDQYFKIIDKNLSDQDHYRRIEWIIEELFFEGQNIFNYTIYKDNPELFKNTIEKLHAVLLNSRNQASIISVLAGLDFSMVNLTDNITGLKIENEALVYEDANPKNSKIFPIIEILNFDIFSLFNSYLLHYGKVVPESNPAQPQKSLLAYLINDKSFDDAVLKDEIVTKLTDLLITGSEIRETNLQLIYSENKKLTKQVTVNEIELRNLLGKRINSFAKSEVRPTSDQVPVRIQIGTPGQIIPDITDDLSDELSGYVVLSKRSTNINNEQFGDWKYHNWAKVKRQLKESVDSNPLEASFLIPGQLATENETQKIFFEISNEKASLTATLEGLNKGISEETTGTGKNHSQLMYLLDGDKTHYPYGLIYGYNYQFAAFAILNSGVLPEDLRDNPEVLNVFKETGIQLTHEETTSYQYLRTRNVSPPNLRLNEVHQYPKELNPLYFELFPEDQTTSKLIVVGEGFNDDFTIIAEKPRTSFWDCYSFVNKGNILADIEPFKLFDPKEERLPVQQTRFIDYIDPAVSNTLYIEIKDLNRLAEPVSAQFDYNGKAYGINGQELNLEKCSKKITVQFDPKAKHLIFDEPNAIIILNPGCIYSIRIYNLIPIKYFDKDGSELRFHKCFDNVYDSTEIIHDKEGNSYYKIAFEEQVIETAGVENVSENALWENFEISDNSAWLDRMFKNDQTKESSVKAIINTDIKFSLFSRVEVQHQKWEWNGRQLNTDITRLRNSLNPVKETETSLYHTTEAMRFEAWAQSDRPDYTSVKTQSRIFASKNKNANVVHEYKNIIDNHSIYLKYKVEIFNRYESLPSRRYATNSVKSSITVDNVDNPWKRHITLSKRKEELPIPSVRFYIPLTNSIHEANDHSNQMADMMLVLDDVWYKEAGLAQKLTLGIKTTENASDGFYPEAGYDPTLSATKTAKVIPTDKEGYLIVDDKYFTGPFGFTFDFNASNPRINSSSFIISGNGLSNYINKDVKDDAYWPMFKLSTRSEIIPQLYDEESGDAAGLNSKWSSPQWVQFMKAVDSFVPQKWRDSVRKNNYLELGSHQLEEQLKIPLLNRFGETFEIFHNWYLIFSTVESNIGGLPVENYYNTFIVNEINETLTSFQSVHEPDKKIQDFKEGFIRIMVVRKSEDYNTSKPTEDIWKEIFGDKDESTKRIKEDNTLAMPILSERIPIKIIT